MRKGFIDDYGSQLLVGARSKDSDYLGPVADITWDETWLWIVTDEYEGSVMLNIEALPHLRRALARIAKRIKDAEQQVATIRSRGV